MFREDDGVSEAKRQSCVWKLKPGLRGVLAAKRDCETEFSISMAATHEVVIFNSQSGELNNAAFRVLLFIAFQRRQSDLRFAGVGTVNWPCCCAPGARRPGSDRDILRCAKDFLDFHSLAAVLELIFAPVFSFETLAKGSYSSPCPELTATFCLEAFII